MNITTQRHKHWCVHACLESANLDQQTNNIWSQEEVEKSFNRFFPQPEKVFQAMLIPTVCFTIGLGNCFHVGAGKDWVLMYNNLDKMIVLITTQKDGHGGVLGHCLRMAEMNDGGFKALDPARGIIDSFSWDFLTKHDCLIYVIGRADLAIQRKESS